MSTGTADAFVAVVVVPHAAALHLAVPDVGVYRGQPVRPCRRFEIGRLPHHDGSGLWCRAFCSCVVGFCVCVWVLAPGVRGHGGVAGRDVSERPVLRQRDEGVRGGGQLAAVVGAAQHDEEGGRHSQGVQLQHRHAGVHYRSLYFPPPPPVFVSLLRVC